MTPRTISAFSQLVVGFCSLRNCLKALGGELLTLFKPPQLLLRGVDGAWPLINLCVIVCAYVYFSAYRCHLQQTRENDHRGGQSGLLEGGVPLANVRLRLLRSESEWDRERTSPPDPIHHLHTCRRRQRSRFNTFLCFYSVFTPSSPFQTECFLICPHKCLFPANFRAKFPRHRFNSYRQARTHHQPPQDQGGEIVFFPRAFPFSTS